MGILDNLESYLELDKLDEAWTDADLELQRQNPHIIVD